LTPTWSGWPAVIAAQNEDVSSTGPWYLGHWNTDGRTWTEFEDAGIDWDEEGPAHYDSISLDVEQYIDRSGTYPTDLWNPVSGERTTWQPVPYPK
jgi:hypothetical protein